jgi:hypothetical protein
MAQVVKKNEEEKIWIETWDDHKGEDVTVSSAIFQVFDSVGVSVQASANATIVDNDTKTPDIYGLVDTTDDAFVVGDSYKVRFVVTIGDDVKRPVVDIDIVAELVSILPLH